MKMKELERRSGVGRETIRFYIKEGLLPEPERPKRNVAVYSDEHLRRLSAIRRLQEERFLPLSVIKTVLDADGAAIAEGGARIPHLEHLLAARLELMDVGERVSLEDAAASAGLSLDDVLALAGAGVIAPEPEGLTRIDAGIVATWARLKDDVIEPAASTYGPADMKLYADLARTMAETETRRFIDRVGPQNTPEQSAFFAQRGMELTGQIFALVRAREILKVAAAINAEDEDGAPARGGDTPRTGPGRAASLSDD